MQNIELRIGNTVKQGTIQTFYENGIHVGYGKCFKFSETEPIELSEDLLLKFGFKAHFNKTIEGEKGFSIKSKIPAENESRTPCFAPQTKQRELSTARSGSLWTESDQC